MAHRSSARVGLLAQILGQVLPSLAALVSVPLIIGRFGEAGFGAFSLAWIIVGAAMMLDFGLARSLTHWMARTIDSGRVARRTVVVVVLAVLGLLGVVGTLAAAALIPLQSRALDFFARSGLADSGLEEAIPWILASIPVNVCLAGILGIIEGLEDFVWMNVLRAPFTLVAYFVPVFVSDGAHVWERVFLNLFLLRIGLLGALALLVAVRLRRYRPAQPAPTNAMEELRSVGRLSVWLAAAALSALPFTYADRFTLGLFATATAIALYQTPLDVLTRTLIVPTSVASLVYPRLARLGARGEAARVEIYRAGAVLVVLFAFPVTLLAAIAEPALGWWIDPGFAERSTPLAMVLAAGVIMNGMARIPVALLQAGGHARAPVMVVLGEAVPFFLVLWLVAGRGDLLGVAIVLSVRSGIDLWLLTLACRASSRESMLWASFPAGLASLLAGAVLLGMGVKGDALRVAVATVAGAAASLAAVAAYMSARRGGLRDVTLS